MWRVARRVFPIQWLRPLASIPLLWSRQPGWKGGDFREPIRRGTGSRARCRRRTPDSCAARELWLHRDVLASRFMMSPLAANTKGGFAAARNLLSRAPRFAPYKPSFLPRSVNVKEERTTASNFGEGPAFKFPKRHVSWPRFFSSIHFTSEEKLTWPKYTGAWHVFCCS